MKNKISKLNYLVEVCLNQFTEKSCPSCKAENFKITSSKFFGITKLFKCQQCFLLYRYPKTNKKQSIKYYQNDYHQPGTTDLPNKEQIKKLKLENFNSIGKDISHWESFFEIISQKKGDKLKVLDYGANWGYSAYQINNFNCVKKCMGLEISSRMLDFGNKNLGIEYIENLNNYDEYFDVIFSSHVIEHMYDPSKIKNDADRILCKGGYIIITCPNGSNAAKGYDYNTWQKHWGQVHPNFISDEYIKNCFAGFKGCVFNSNKNLDVDFHKELQKPIQTVSPYSTYLLFVGKKS